MMELSIGDDGRNRFDYNTFGSMTARCQPSTARTSWRGRGGCAAWYGRILVSPASWPWSTSWRRNTAYGAGRSGDVAMQSLPAAATSISGPRSRRPGTTGSDGKETHARTAEHRQGAEFLHHVWRWRARAGGEAALPFERRRPLS